MSGANATASDTEVVKQANNAGGCFIATAAFGTPMAAEVMELRVFRDNYLLQRGWGQRFVKFYYAHSPPIADFIRQHDWLRAAVRGVLRPLIWAAHQINSRATTHASQAPAQSAGGAAHVLQGREGRGDLLFVLSTASDLRRPVFAVAAAGKGAEKHVYAAGNRRPVSRRRESAAL